MAVLHHWPDKHAMQRDSILLISETVLPDPGVLSRSVLSDMQMMGLFALLERKNNGKQCWRQPASSSSKFWLSDECDQSPASLAEQPLYWKLE